jgi:hypothetical protein
MLPSSPPAKPILQDSADSPPLLERDPDNRLLARGPRFRLPAWMIRDHALAASGLLNPALGGPPVKPWQPEGVWEEIFMGRYTYQPSVGRPSTAARSTPTGAASAPRPSSSTAPSAASAKCVRTARTRRCMR